MAQPYAVKRAAESADEQIKQLAQSMSPSAPPAQSEPPAEAPAEPAEEHAEESAAEETEHENPTTDSGVEAAQDEPPAASGESDAEHRYRVLQGKYKAETKRQREQIDRLTRQVENMTNLLARVSTPQPEAAPKEPPEPKAAFAAPSVPELTDRERDAVGMDYLDAAARHTLSQLSPALKTLEQELKALRADVKAARELANTAQSSTQSTKRMTLNDRLDAEMPEWRDINVDEDFKEWLKQEDDYSGEARGTLLLRAYERGDARRVLRFFQAFKAEHADAPGRRPPESPPEDTSERKPRVDPKALVAPGKGRSAPRNGAQQAKIQWTPETVALFYKDVQNGMYRNDPAERDRLEADIFAAQTDGRL